MQETQTPSVTRPDDITALSFQALATTSKYGFDLKQPLDRGHDVRGDTAWLESRLTDASTEFVPMWQMQNLVTGDPVHLVLLQATEMAAWLPHAESITLLGMREEHACFSVVLPKSLEPTPPGPGNAPLQNHGRWVNVRDVADQLPQADWAILTYARAMAYWHQRSRFCSDCGSPTISIHGGHIRRCTDPDCGQQHFPRSDPAIIVLVFAGERALLGRQPSWPQGRYSTLAGFVEPGESVEQAVAREVYEEAGVQLRKLQYFGSQSFPFPASLMLGFHAEAASEEIHLHDGELADARWFTRRQLREGLDTGTVSLPPRFAISHQLISAWFNSGDHGTL